MSKFSELFDNEATFGGTFTFTSPALQAAMVKAREAKVAKTAEIAAGLFGALETHNTTLLTNLRNVRKAEKAAKETLEKFTAAMKYFCESGNFGPLYPFLPYKVRDLCVQLGSEVPTPEEQKIPETK